MIKSVFYMAIKYFWDIVWYFFTLFSVCNRKNPTILYKDDQFMFINKSYDMMINSNDEKKYTVQTFLKEKYPHLIMKNLVHEFYFPHRLDYATSGVLCVPVCKSSCKLASEAFEQRLTKKYYIALVRGHLSKEMIYVNEPIGEDSRETSFIKMCAASYPYCVSPRKAETFILNMETGFYENRPATKILLKPISGRRHQLRVHCYNLGHTIIGDYTYSNRKDVTPYRMFLHSIRLILPYGKKCLDIQTLDPFMHNDTLKKWTSFKIFNTLSPLSYSKLDKYSSCCR